VPLTTKESPPSLPVGTTDRIALSGLTLDLGRGLLLDEQGVPQEVRPQAFEVLRTLAVNIGRLVTKHELMAAVWPDVTVTDDSLVQAVSDLRRVLHDDAHRIIRTVPRRGYMLLSDGSAQPDTPSVAPAEPADPLARMPAAAGPWRPRVRFGAGLVAAAVLVGALWFTAPWSRSGGSGVEDMARQAMPERPSIAVLAFRDPHSTSDGQMLARGLAESVVAELARNVDLRVVSAHSSFALAGSGLSAAEIGRRLRSRYLVDGTVERVGDTLRLEVEMIDSLDGHVTWSSKRVAESGDVLAQRDDLVWRIAGSLHSRLRQSEERRALVHPPVNLDVYEMTLRAVALKHRFQPDATREARSLLEKAIASDPTYAPAWLYLAMVNALDSLLQLTGEWHPGRADEMIVQAQRAIELDPQLPAAYFALALAQVEARQFKAALDNAQRCAALGPADADCLQYVSAILIRMGRGEEALTSIERALDLSPIPPPWLHAAHTGALWLVRRNEEAVRAADECLQMAPRYLVCRKFRLTELAELGRLDEARQEAASIQTQFPAADVAWMESHFTGDAVEARRRFAAAAVSAGLPHSASATGGAVARR
jgi:TolB-like protein/DNA-binding winged helix-turn-helix (wHTH) protein